MHAVELRHRVPGVVSSDVRQFEGRLVVWVDVEATARSGALSFESSSKIEYAAQTAREKGYPLIVVMRSRRPVRILCG